MYADANDPHGSACLVPPAFGARFRDRGVDQHLKFIRVRPGVAGFDGLRRLVEQAPARRLFDERPRRAFFWPRAPR